MQNIRTDASTGKSRRREAVIAAMKRERNRLRLAIEKVVLYSPEHEKLATRTGALGVAIHRLRVDRIDERNRADGFTVKPRAALGHPAASEIARFYDHVQRVVPRLRRSTRRAPRRSFALRNRTRAGPDDGSDPSSDPEIAPAGAAVAS
jgi:hypothetical protein